MEEASFQARTLNFFRKRKLHNADGAPSAETQQRKKKRQRIVPKLATCDWLHALHTTLEIGLGHKGLLQFLPEPKSHTDEESGSFRVESVPLLTIGADQESKQRAAMYFLASKGYSTVLLMPIHHRRNNDMNFAFESAGFSGVVRRCMVKANVAYGPWGTGLFMSDLRDASVDLSANMSASHPLLLALWPRICRDRGFCLQDAVSEAGRAAFLAELPTSPIASTKGVKCSYKKLLSVLDATEFCDKYSGEKLLLLMYLALQRGWVESYDELWDTGRCPKIILSMAKVLAAIRPGAATQEKAKATASTSMSRGSSAPSASSPSRDIPAPATERPSVGGGQASSSAPPPQGNGVDRRDAVNTLHVVLHSLANPDEEAKARVVLLAAGAVRRAHKDDIHSVRSVDGVRNFYIKMSSWGFM